MQLKVPDFVQRFFRGILSIKSCGESKSLQVIVIKEVGLIDLKQTSKMINFRNIICRHLHRDGHPGKGSIQIETHPNAGVSFPIGIQSPCRMIGVSNHLSKVFTVGSVTILRFGDWILIGIIMEGQPGSLRMVNYGLMLIYRSLLP